MIQSQTGERSFTVAQTQVENLPNTGRNFASFAALVPGVVGTTVSAGGNAAISRLGGGTTNFLLDGVSNVDPGGNGQGLQLNMDAIAEVRVLSSAYQAEYGRSSGLQISGVTKSGTNQFHGSFFDIERNGTWNANSWSNEQNGIAKPVSKERDYGYTIGGPIGRAGGQNSLFFFYAHQFAPRTTGGAVNLFRLPTLLERRGDFSQSTDNTGALFPYIRDASTGLPCSAADTRGLLRGRWCTRANSSEPPLSARAQRSEDVSGAEHDRPELQPPDGCSRKTSAWSSSRWSASTTRRLESCGYRHGLPCRSARRSRCQARFRGSTTTSRS